MHEHLKGTVNKGLKNQCKNHEQSMLLNVAQCWIKQDRDQSKKIKIKLKSKRLLLQRLIKPCDFKPKVYNILTRQYQSSSGLLGKIMNIQNIYCYKIS